ncbi:MAG: hypothetical protein GC157_18525 [Frankiales bacterium]|nr:hypothetical protein [Frankiales bacterium]
MTGDPTHAPAGTLHSSSGVSAFTGRPFVLLTWSGSSGQLTPDEARTLALDIIAAADAAETDAHVLEVLKRLHVDEDARARFLLAIRERRGQS